MKILFEEYQYEIAALTAVLGERLPSLPCQFLGDKVRFDCVGYFYSDTMQDAVFILPKVMLQATDDGQVIALGTGLAPEVLINFDSAKVKEVDRRVKEFIFKLAVWLYQAIGTYSLRKGKNSSVELLSITDVKFGNDSTSTIRTYLDIIIQLFQFHKEHKKLFTYISLLRNTGNNRINWTKTVTQCRPVISNHKPVYLDFINYRKEVDANEELIVLFYSVLRFLQEKYYFPFELIFNYELIPSGKIQAMITTSKGTRLLKKIKHNYFKDELILLWHLLYAFFEKAEELSHGRQHADRLLVRKFNNVFEDMIDRLLSDPSDTIPKVLKEQPDGKLVDHIYRDRSLLGDGDMFFIGDSKYYQETVELGANSVYKQFTYAKNVIQFNVGLFAQGKATDSLEGKRMSESIRYRDDVTEGYDVTPNFFIRGMMQFDDLFDVQDHLANQGFIYLMKQFKNRLFDRDTLVVQSYNINFLFVLKSYISRTSNEQFRAKARQGFRHDILASLNDRYNFFKASFNDEQALEDFVDKNFKHLNGMMFRTATQPLDIIFACEKCYDHVFLKHYGDVSLIKI